MQLWFAGSGRRRAGNPYFLYGASDLGRMLYGASDLGRMAGLLGYPLLLEPVLDLARRSHAWSLGYDALILLAGATGLIAWRRAPNVAAVSPVGEESAPASCLRLRWLALAAVPSALLLAVTAHIATDLAALPLLWVIPLAPYLLTFVLTFARRPWLADG